MLNSRANRNSGLPLAALVLCTQAFCAGQPKPAVHDIRFGVIEPPVVAQADITVRAPTSNQQSEPKPMECSGLAWLDGCLLIASDRHEHLLFICPVDLDRMTLGAPEPCVIVPNEQDLLKDIEALTLMDNNGVASLCVMSSLSNAPDAQALPQRRQLLSCNVTQVSPFAIEHRRVLSMSALRQELETCFHTIRVKPYYTYNADYTGQDKNTYRWGNVEGITFTPDRRRLLCGMRNPLFDNAAILFTVAGLPAPAQQVQADAIKLTDVFLLDLEGRGVSDLAWDPITGGYLITAAKSNGPRLDPDQPFPPNSLDSALFWWNGAKDDKPVLVARIPDMTIEAVCRLGRSPYIALGSDEGDVSEGRTARQSIVTILEFMGVQYDPID